MLTPQEALDGVVREVEAHVAEGGWDRPAKLFALVPTAELVAAEPALAAELGLDPTAGGYVPIDQEVPAGTDLEQTLTTITWPPEVAGCVAVVERVVLPPSADADLPLDPAAAAAFAAEHPERQELRMVAAVLRDGTTACAMRFRSHDDASSVVVGPDLVPALLELINATLADGPVLEEPDEPTTRGDQ